MVDQTANSVGNLEPRNASIKRPHDADDGDTAKAPSLKRFRRPSKRQKRNARSNGEGATNSWNNGATSTIRTSLGGPKKPSALFREEETCVETLQEFRKALSQMPNDATASSFACRKAQLDIHVAEVDLAYSQYFPANIKPYQPLFLRGVPPVESFKQQRPPLWAFVEKCMENGQLQALKDGKLKEELAKHGIGLPRRHGGAKKHQQSQQPANSLKPLEDPPESIDNHARFYVQLSPEPELAAREDDGDRTESDDSGDDGGVMLNVEMYGQENEGMSETRPMVIEEDTDEGEYDPEKEFKGVAQDGAEKLSEEVDPMIGYADASRIAISPEPRSPQSRGEEARVSRPETLAELDDADFDKQLRYFYITQNSRDPDIRNTPVRCLVCTKPGHMARDCLALTCADCGSHNAHFVPFCPRKQKCSKCRGQGHEPVDCPSKLKLTASELVCDLCQDSGHTEHECELLWRTSGRPKPPNQSDTRWKYIYCYECGHPNHLGNDCPTRRPGKAMGSGTWSLKGSAGLPNQPTHKVANGLSIRGRAQQQQPPETINLDSESDEATNFVRPKVPAPTNRGTIQISASSQSSNQHANQNSMSQPYQPSYQAGYNNQGNMHYGGNPNANTQKAKTRGSRIQLDNSYDQPYLYPGHPGTRSRPNTTYQPPIPPELPPKVKARTRSRPNPNHQPRQRAAPGESYRPMPSAASNAWKQHRT